MQSDSIYQFKTKVAHDIAEELLNYREVTSLSVITPTVQEVDYKIFGKEQDKNIVSKKFTLRFTYLDDYTEVELIKTTLYNSIELIKLVSLVRNFVNEISYHTMLKRKEAAKV